MIKTKTVSNLSANSLQLIGNQIFGLVIFYILSVSLNKTNFGHINLVLAVLLAVFNILSLGIDQLVIKRVASGQSAQNTLSLYICHVLIAGLLFYGFLWSGKILFPHAPVTYSLLLLIGTGKLMIFFSSPFKQVASGMERFKLLASMSVISNMVRCAGLICLLLFHNITLHNAVIVFVGGDLAELLFSVFLFKIKTKIALLVKWDWGGYLSLIRESLPQAGVVVITSALARFDWIYIGFTLSAIKLAEYSFVYKVFEISTLPLLAIAPLLIPYFTKLFLKNERETGHLKLLIKFEIMIAVFIGLILNICWAPVIDALTTGKYGAVNVKTIFILSLCMPLLYVNNFLWTIYFAQGQLKMILHSFIISLLINVAGDIVLIPFYKNEGAAFAYLLSVLAQSIFYLSKNKITDLGGIWGTLLIVTGCALCSGFAIKLFSSNYWPAWPLAVILYVLLLSVTGQFKLAALKEFRQLFSR